MDLGRRWGKAGQDSTCLSSQGTTGSPKGATLSHYNIVNNSNMIGHRLKMHEKVRQRWPQGCGKAGRGGTACWAPPAGWRNWLPGLLAPMIDSASCLHL